MVFINYGHIKECPYCSEKYIVTAYVVTISFSYLTIIKKRVKFVF